MTQKQREVRVAKLGGSLFDLDDVKSRLLDWFVSQSPLPTVLVCGGGPSVQRIRDTRRSVVDDETAHWLAIEQMDRNALWLGQHGLSQWPVVSDMATWWQGVNGQVTTWEDPRSRDSLSRLGFAPQLNRNAPAICIFQPLKWLRNERGMADELPRDWSVSSDSIAAHLAYRIEATEFVLFKSCGPTVGFVQGGTQKKGLVDRGWVDDYFPRINLDGVTTRWVNLRKYHVGFRGKASCEE